MKIAVTHHFSTIVGGAEHAVRSSIEELLEQGHEVLFIHEDTGGDGAPVAPDALKHILQLTDQNEVEVTQRLREWQPDLIFNHGLHGAHHLAMMLPIAPTVSYVHDYVGACISGSKTHHFPQTSLCNRQFGPGCLALYLPRRCGGKSPLTMMKLYAHNEAMRTVLLQNDAIILASEHMASEWRRMGYAPQRIFVVTPYCGEPPAHITPVEYLGKIAPAAGEEVRLCFLGRMEPLKGGATLLEALPKVQKALKAPLRLTLAGDGRSKADWEDQARRLVARHRHIKIEFLGLVNAEQREAMLNDVHALVMPSVWPEPFGQVGVQALMSGSPAIAFNSGGAPDWLQNGVNGLLANAYPPNASNLAKAIIELFTDPNRYQRMSAAATRTTGRFAKSVHFLKIDASFKAALNSPRPIRH